jgi:Rod binding domain-containing protein
MLGADSTMSIPMLPTVSLEALPSARNSPEAVGKAFEAVFASLLIKQMRESFDGESLFGEDPGDVRGGMFDHFMGEHIAKSGKLGIGAMIRRQLEKRGSTT